MKLIKVKLIRYTPEGEKLVAVAAKQSLSRKPFEYQWGKMSDEEVEVWIKETLKRNHLSPWEHSVYTFVIEGISRACSHQLVRHRIASYTQLSQRFAKMIKEYFSIVKPPRISENSEASKIFDEAVSKAYEAYVKLLDLRIPPEDARYVLPQAVTTKIVVTMNARELRHFFGLRTCLKAQWEIRYVAWKMREELLKVHPLLFKWTGPRCINIENVTRKSEPITVEDILSNKAMLTIERCPENIVARNIPQCIKRALSIVSILENRAYNVDD